MSSRNNCHGKDQKYIWVDDEGNAFTKKEVAEEPVADGLCPFLNRAREWFG